MSKPRFPYAADDVSALSRSLTRQIEALGATPSHLEMMNMLARGAGFRNFQHFRADAEARARLEAPPAPAEPVDHQKVARVAGHFDGTGAMLRWPGKTSHQELCLWALWARLPAGVRLTETEINHRLLDLHRFADHALLRREMVNRRLVGRTTDGRAYWRIEQKPPADAAALIRRLELTRRGA
jgi:hypothetical protein